MSLIVVTPLNAHADPGGLDAAARVLEDYRQHYGQTPSPVLTRDWLGAQLARGVVSVFIARLNGAPLGIATTFVSPATLGLGHAWHLRDLYVVPQARRIGVGAALVDAVRAAATADGAVRLSLQTEPDNEAALGLYRRLGFTPVDGVISLTLPLGRE